MSMHHVVAAVWKTVPFGRRSDCALCGYPVLSGETVLRLTHRYGRSSDLCNECAVAVAGTPQATDEAALGDAELHEIASRLAMRVAYTIEDIERLLKAVHGDPAIAEEICDAAAAANCADPVRFFASHRPQDANGCTAPPPSGKEDKGPGKA
jgi:hypothetical protein